MLGEGTIKFEDRAGGDFVICRFTNGAAIMLSRQDMFKAARHMLDYSLDSFAAQPAKIITFTKEAKA